MKLKTDVGTEIEVTRVLKVIIDGEEREYDPEEWSHAVTRNFALTCSALTDSLTLTTINGKEYRPTSWAIVECPSRKDGDKVRIMTDAEALCVLAREFDIDIRNAKITGLCWYDATDNFHIEYRYDEYDLARYYIAEGTYCEPELIKTREWREEVA